MSASFVLRQNEVGIGERDITNCSVQRGFKRIWLKISRCKTIEDFLFFIVQLEFILNSQAYLTVNNPLLASSLFHLKQRPSSTNWQRRRNFSSYLMQKILYHAVLSNSPYDGFQCPDLSTEFVQIISHRQLVPAAASTFLKPGVLDGVSFGILLANCLTSKHVSRSQKLVDFFHCLKYFFDGEKIYGLLRVYYHRRDVMRHSRGSHALDTPRKKFVSKLGPNMDRAETSPRYWVCLVGFAERLSKTILQELRRLLSTSTEVALSSHHPERQQDYHCMNPKFGYHPNFATALASMEGAAVCLERSITSETSSAIRRHRHFHNPHQYHQYHQQYPLSIQLSQSLTRFADDLASQLIEEASRSVEKRMSSICEIADSILRSISRVRPSDLKSALINGSQQKLRNETKVNGHLS